MKEVELGSDRGAEIAAAAARLVVEEGLEYGPAKRRAAAALGARRARAGRAELPDNDVVEDHVREYLALFHADTHPAELVALRRVALHWMRELEPFRPHLAGAVWRGTATRRSVVHLDLYCDDPKSAEIELLNRRVDFDVHASTDARGRPFDRLVLAAACPELGEPVTVCLSILDHDDLRGALRADARGRTDRGDRVALERLLEDAA